MREKKETEERKKKNTRPCSRASKLGQDFRKKLHDWAESNCGFPRNSENQNPEAEIRTNLSAGPVSTLFRANTWNSYTPGSSLCCPSPFPNLSLPRFGSCVSVATRRKTPLALPVIVPLSLLLLFIDFLKSHHYALSMLYAVPRKSKRAARISTVSRLYSGTNGVGRHLSEGKPRCTHISSKAWQKYPVRPKDSFKRPLNALIFWLS